MKSSVLFALAFASSFARAQATFEVASIHPFDPNANATCITGVDIQAGGRFRAPCITLQGLVATAFNISMWQLSGGEPWITKDNYSVDAKPTGSVAPTLNLRHAWFDIEDERLRQMLQALLAERFHLKVHRETRQGTVYVLTKSGKPVPMRPHDSKANSGAGYGDMGYAGGQYNMYNTSMAGMAKYAANYFFHAPVVDQTGIKGSFDYRQRTPDLDPDYGNTTDYLLHFIAECGLKLEKTTGPVEMLVIDHVERPTEN
jgi:uncharacterized protein (TIGR03435 family)